MNTIVNRDGKLYGYNTDYAGFAYLAGYEFLPQKYFTWKSICIFYEVCCGFEGIEGSD